MSKANLIIIAAVGLLLLFLRGYWIHEGESRIQAKWDATTQANNMAVLERVAQNIKETALKESQLKKETERIDQDDQKRQASLVADNAALAADNQRLQRTIDQLRRVSPSSTNACPASVLNERAAALESLGQCATEYSTLVTDARGLTSQVLGLQSYVRLCYGDQVNESR